MSFDLPPRKDNPFEAPRARIGEHVSDLDLVDVSEAETEDIRRAYLNHEASVKALGSLSYLGAFFFMLLVIFCFAAAGGAIDATAPVRGLPPEQMGIFFAVLGGVCLVGLLINVGVGYGLRNLQVWARWVMIVLISLSFVSLALRILLAGLISPEAAGRATGRALFPGLIYGYFLYLVASRKGAVVFSREYKDVIRKTPHIKYKTSIIVKVCIAVLLVVILMALAGGLMSYFAARR
jgi:hypothetical protein